MNPLQFTYLCLLSLLTNNAAILYFDVRKMTQSLKKVIIIRDVDDSCEVPKRFMCKKKSFFSVSISI